MAQTYKSPRTSRQIENRNFLSPNGFRFSVRRCPGSAFFCNQANIPDMTLGVANQANYLRDIPIPGDKIEFGDLNIRFLVDEDLGNYMEIQKWIRGLGFPDSLKEIFDLQDENERMDTTKSGLMDIYSDGTLTVLGSNQRPNFIVKFRDLFPVTLSTLNFDASQTDVEYFTADVQFKYTIYEITDLEGTPL